MHGAYETIENRPRLSFERRLAHPVDSVWRAVTDPGELGQWFPSSVEGEIRAGGRLEFRFPEDIAPPMDGRVLTLDPPRRFAFSWGEDELCFELEPGEDAGSCVLRFTVLLGTEDKAARDAAGWHVCLDTLQKVLDGAPSEQPGSRPSEEWRGHYDEYVRRGLPASAPIPG